MDSGYYRAIMLWAWGIPIPDLKLPNGFSKALQENVTAAMNYSMTDGGEGNILWSNGFYDFDPLDPGQSGENSIMPFILSLTESFYADPADFQDEVDTIGRRRLTEAQIRRQLSEDEPRWTHHPIFESPSEFPHLDISACNQPGWSYFLVFVAMETPNHKHRKEFWQVMEDERVNPVLAYPPPEEGRRLEESFVGEACSEAVFVWSKKLHEAPSPPPPPPPPEGGVREREYSAIGGSVAVFGFIGILFFGFYGQRFFVPPKPVCAPAGAGAGFAVVGGGGIPLNIHDLHNRQDEICPKNCNRGPNELLFTEKEQRKFV